MQGTIVKLMLDKGFGFIKGEDRGEYFFHRSSLKNVSLEMLQIGQEVTFEELDTNKGPRAEDIFI